MPHNKEKNNVALQEELYEILQETDDESTRQHLQYLYDKNFDSFESVEKEIKENPLLESLDDIKNCSSFDERVTSIYSSTQKQPNKNTKKYKRLTSIAASFLVFISIGLMMRFWVFSPANNGNPTINYVDSEITVQIATEEETNNILQDFYLPQLSILTNPEYKVGKHNKTHEIIYITVSGIHAAESYNREVSLSIYLEERYFVKNENNFHTDNFILIENKRVSIKEIKNNSSIQYYCGFNVLSVRYYIELSTIIENDYNDFLIAFLNAY